MDEKNIFWRLLGAVEHAHKVAIEGGFLRGNAVHNVSGQAQN